MNQPPEDDQPKIVEPPIDPETDTRPLKPLKPNVDEPDIPLRKPFPDRRPPATILREATPITQTEIKRISAPLPDDTDRVRLVPRNLEPTSWRIILTTMGRKTSTIGLDVRQMLTIGRIDPDGDQHPDFDLTPHLAIEHGVSRQHAAFIPTSDGLYIVDLESTNGTWINGDYLTPGERHPLSPGDRIELGLLKLLVKTVSTSSRQSS